QNLFETMQIYLGSLYVNDFNRFGRTYQVIAQADAPFRDRPENITRLKTRNDKGQMVPLGTLVKVSDAHGPDRAMRYNGYPAAEYESFRLPLAIILIVPMCLLFAITGVWLKGSDNNIFTQIGLIVLVGLACKNAILIVEFAKHKQDEGQSPFQAAIEASHLR